MFFLKDNYLKMLFLGALIVFFAGCTQSPPPSRPVFAKNQASGVNPVLSGIYLIGPGDQLEIIFHMNPDFSVKEYKIDIEDTLRIDLYYYPVLGRTVKVRPDGKITLPRIGEVYVAGKKPNDLADEISKMYEPYLTKPVTTVEVINFNAKVKKMKDAITNFQENHSRFAIVRPDGAISLPYIHDINAAGLNVGELTKIIEEKYHKIIKDMSVTIVVTKAKSNQVFVMGEVKKSDFYNLVRPVTLSQLIAMAGGFTKDANMSQILMISRGKDGKPETKIIDMEKLYKNDEDAIDPVVKQYDVIFVPRTKLAEATLIGDAIWKIIPIRFVGSFGYSFSVNTQ